MQMPWEIAAAAAEPPRKKKKSGKARSRIARASVRRAADGKPCPYCGVPMLRGTPTLPTLDRVTPGAAGGRYLRENVIIACRPCNWSKDNFTLEEWHRRLVVAGDPRALRVSVIMAERAAAAARLARPED